MVGLPSSRCSWRAIAEQEVVGLELLLHEPQSDGPVAGATEHSCGSGKHDIRGAATELDGVVSKFHLVQIARECDGSLRSSIGKSSQEARVFDGALKGILQKWGSRCRHGKGDRN